VGLLGILLFALDMLRRSRGSWQNRPAVGQALLLVNLAASVFLYGVAFARPLDSVERSGALRALLLVVAATGLALIMSECLRSRADVDLIAAVLVAGACVSAAVGIIQFWTPVDLAGLLRPPGFVLNNDLSTGERSDFVRVLGSAGHPIEFSVTLGALAPLGLHLARFSSTSRARRAAGVATALMLTALPMAVSRSGMVTVAVSMVAYAVVLNGRERLNALMITAVGLVAFRSFIPGLLGTLRSLFLRADQDDSITGRTEDYDAAFALIDERPLFGLGIGTFRPDAYFFLDNQWLLSALEGGLLGVMCLLLLFLGGAALSRGAYHRTSDRSVRSLTQAITAALLSLGLSAFTYDLMSFQQSALLTFVLVGIAAALHRLSLAPDDAELVGVQRALR
jgi:O-antigen ligase